MNQKKFKDVAPRCAVVIVTYNSENVLPTCMNALLNQTVKSNLIIIVDSGSKDTSYLSSYGDLEGVSLKLCRDNVGYCHGNNLGMMEIPKEIDYVLFLNPDAFLSLSFIEQALQFMESSMNAEVGALSGPLLGYDLNSQKSSGRIDSTGIFQNWYGKWYDRHQGQSISKIDSLIEQEVPAICGALMFCRKAALLQSQLKRGEIMDSSFYMYKEDIDLSLRLREKGWKIVLLPHLIAHHCRGWQKERAKIPRFLRLLSAKNELRLHARFKSPYLVYSFIKYFAVKLFNV